MRVYCLFYGGCGNYSAPEIPRDLEMFSSLRTARDVFWGRVDFDPEFPCVGSDAEMQVFFADPSDSRDPYPDRIIKMGRRGGVRVERC